MLKLIFHRIVTGVRFKSYKNVFHLQVQEGVIGNMSLVDEPTVSWKALPQININRSNLGAEFHALTINERQIALNHIQLSPGHVLTGLRFVLRNGILTLQGRQSKIDVITGRIEVGSEAWISHTGSLVSVEWKLRYFGNDN